MFFIAKYSIVAIVFYMIMSGLFTIDFSNENVSVGFNYIPLVNVLSKMYPLS